MLVKSDFKYCATGNILIEKLMYYTFLNKTPSLFIKRFCSPLCVLYAVICVIHAHNLLHNIRYIVALSRINSVCTWENSKLIFEIS